MKKKLKIAAILLMAGEGQRFEDSLPKQFHNLSGKKIYLHTLDIFLRLNLFNQIIIVCNKNNIKEIQKEIVCKNKNNIKIIEGGKTRQESSYNGLTACNEKTDIVVIHDGVRPFVSDRIILENIENAKKYKAVNTCIDTFDTIVESKDKLKITNIPKRKSLLRGQTPQSFDYKLILNAHKKAKRENLKNISDDCTLAINARHIVYIVKGDDHNIKITTKLDLFIAEQLFSIRSTEITNQNDFLQNKKFVVVGGNGGIGKEICKQLKQNKAFFISLSRSSKIPLDLTDTKSIKLAFNKIFEKYGKIDGLINSAGILKISALKSLSHEEIQNLININFTGLVLCCKFAKIKENGHILNIGSSSCFKGRKHFSIYSSCKAAVVNFTQALAEEYPKMKVNTIIPQRTNTPMRRKNFPKEKIDILLPPEKVATAVINLLKNKKLTGNIIEVKK